METCPTIDERYFNSLVSYGELAIRCKGRKHLRKAVSVISAILYNQSATVSGQKEVLEELRSRLYQELDHLLLDLYIERNLKRLESEFEVVRADMFKYRKGKLKTWFASFKFEERIKFIENANSLCASSIRRIRGLSHQELAKQYTAKVTALRDTLIPSATSDKVLPKELRNQTQVLAHKIATRLAKPKLTRTAIKNLGSRLKMISQPPYFEALAVMAGSVANARTWIAQKRSQFEARLKTELNQKLQ